MTNALFVPLIYFFYPETTRLTLEEIDMLFVDDAHREKFGMDTEKGSVQEMEDTPEKL